MESGEIGVKRLQLRLGVSGAWSSHGEADTGLEEEVPEEVFEHGESRTIEEGGMP